jgi:catechol 2,3-dioxygenase-like lactoylglutathione lyase family enzyme
MRPRAFFLLLSICVALGLTTERAGAQLAPFGPAGVVMGHVHLNVTDIDAHKKFWSALGGTPVKNGQLEMMAFPGVFVNLRVQKATAGTVGSTVNHFGFQVKHMQDWLPKWQAAGLKMEPQTRPTQVFLIGPDEVRVEILEDEMLDVPLRMHHVHLFVPDPVAAQAWYAKTFGAVPGKRGQFDAADLPGVNLTFTKADTPTAPTMGRSIDHIGFEVKGLEPFIKKLEASGIKFDRPYQKSQLAPTLSISYLTDPWGTYIELTENLTPGSGAK